jgi:hypothetical protein
MELLTFYEDGANSAFFPVFGWIPHFETPAQNFVASFVISLLIGVFWMYNKDSTPEILWLRDDMPHTPVILPVHNTP